MPIAQCSASYLENQGKFFIGFFIGFFIVFQASTDKKLWITEDHGKKTDAKRSKKCIEFTFVEMSELKF